MGSQSRAAPLRPCPANPIQGTGHAGHAGRGTRRVVVDGAARGPAGGGTPGWHVLGRETYLAPVTWVDGWPIVGELAPVMAAPPWPSPVAPPAVRDDFDADRLHPHWVSLRSRPAECWSTTQRPGWLRLRARGSSMDDADVTFMGRRQRRPSCRVRTLIDPTDGRGGLSVRLDEQHHYDIEVGDGGEWGQRAHRIRGAGGSDASGPGRTGRAEDRCARLIRRLGSAPGA